MKNLRIAICTPSSGFVRVEWAESVSKLQTAFAKNKKLGVQDSKLFYICSSVIPNNRQRCVMLAQKWGATHVLFIDDDMAFSVDAIKLLLRSSDLPIVACNAPKRMYPLQFMSLDFNDKEVVTDDTTIGLQEVKVTGNAVVLIQMKVFENMEKPWFFFPYYPETNEWETEDYYFNKKAQVLGYPIVIDHDASKGIVHIGSHNFNYNDVFHKVASPNYSELNDEQE